MKVYGLANGEFVGWFGAIVFAVCALVAPPSITIASSHTAGAASRTTGGLALTAGAWSRSFGVRSGQEPAENTSSSQTGAGETGAGKPGASGRASKPEPERGYAAFYGASLEGHKTACGGVYSASKLTAAHRSLPCGTKLRVTNLRNGKTVRVTVTDHGPFSNGRILDLSYAAAVHLDFIKQGTTLVKVEVLR
jgi:peptidoglycan lytic transglycosylase